jgi:hypothetical protein
MSPLLLENSNKGQETSSQAAQSLNEVSGILRDIDGSLVMWSTPKKSTDLKVQAAEFQKLNEQGFFTQRLLFRKILKGFEEQESVLADKELQIKSLETQLEAARPRKRRKVKTCPNSKFADISAIRQAQQEANGEAIEGEATDDDNQSDTTLDCILVE